MWADSETGVEGCEFQPRPTQLPRSGIGQRTSAECGPGGPADEDGRVGRESGEPSGGMTG